MEDAAISGPRFCPTGSAWVMCSAHFPVPPPQVHYILQEVVMGGMVLETNMNEIVAQVELQNRMEKSEVRG